MRRPLKTAIFAFNKLVAESQGLFSIIRIIEIKNKFKTIFNIGATLVPISFSSSKKLLTLLLKVTTIIWGRWETMQKEIIKYDDQFKRTVVEMLESGELQSMEQAKKVFNIKGSSIISRWIKKFGKEDILPKIRMRRMIDEVDNHRGTELYEKILIHMQ